MPKFVMLLEKFPREKEEMIFIMREGRDYLGEGGIDVAGILNEIPVVPYSIELPNSVRVKNLAMKGMLKNVARQQKNIVIYLCMDVNNRGDL